MLKQTRVLSFIGLHEVPEILLVLWVLEENLSVLLELQIRKFREMFRLGDTYHIISNLLVLLLGQIIEKFQDT